MDEVFGTRNAAVYPETVQLVSLYASPRWRPLAVSGGSRLELFLAELCHRLSEDIDAAPASDTAFDVCDLRSAFHQTALRIDRALPLDCLSADR
ncbi:hypothetical protein [Streptomyces sp. NPDC048527]|uniref:hypothetical protein n=1 Tax=Streptomyces sp. NPDC048527 TaxID=3365568 RepID=UPI0037174AB9